MYHLALFPLAPTNALEEQEGWSMVGFIGFVLVANLVVIFITAIIDTKRKLYLRKLKKKHQALMEQRALRRALYAKDSSQLVLPTATDPKQSVLVPKTALAVPFVNAAVKPATVQRTVQGKS